MKRVQGGLVWIKRAEIFKDAAAWAADVRAHNRSYRVAAPAQEGDAWVVTLGPLDGAGYDHRMWYRQLGGGLAINCMAIKPFDAPTAVELELTRKVCSGVQRVKTGIFVPFQLSKTKKRTDLVLALIGEPLNWSVSLERVADSPAWRFDPKGADGRQRAIARGKLSGGDWFVSGGMTRGGRKHYDVVARRTIGALELACYGDTYRGEAHARKQLALCLELRKP